MNQDRNERMKETLREVAAEFMAREANRNSLITVTRTDLNDAGDHAIIYISVFPETAEEPALKFANRNRTELVHFFEKRVKARMPGHIEFMIDLGEKNRRRLDELS